MPAEEFTAEQVDAAVELLSDPERLKHAQAVVTHAAPALQRILNEALDEGGYLTATGAAVAQAAGSEPLEDRIVAVRTLLAEETRLGMLVGATVGFELARVLASGPLDTTPTPNQEPDQT
ncbi:MAG: hypothetical protein H0V81_00635 [Solirubrobacterales bacterium]|nr:hypothetical protein [Solirubrobacterales bacterium]